jgi:hypothetical protein
MIRWQLHLLWPLAAVLIGLAGFALYVFAHSDRLYRLKLLLIPAMLAVCAFSFTFFAARLGYGAPAPLPVHFEYLTHKVILEGPRKTWIDILAVSRKPLERDARLHRVPWSEKLENSLKLAREMRKTGGDIELHRGDNDDYPGYVPKRVMPQDVAPKDPIPEQRPAQPDILAPDTGRI